MSDTDYVSTTSPHDKEMLMVVVGEEPKMERRFSLLNCLLFPHFYFPWSAIFGVT
jgi:hypothetical protein